MNSHRITIFLICVLLLAFQYPSGRAIRFSNHWRVGVENGLSHKKTLLVHCKSGDDDLGAHYLSVGSEFSWEFKMNYFANTLFWCYFAPDRYHHASTNVFWYSDHLFQRCFENNCSWVARDDGVYLRNIPLRSEEFMKGWDRGLK